MTPRPVAPESETPETDEFSNPSTEGDNDSFVAIEHYNSLLEHARSLERRLSLAQTEIKGHMRVAKEVRDDALEAAAKVCLSLREPNSEYTVFANDAREDCAHAIRALKSHA